MDKLTEFREAFRILTGNRNGPFPWQESLYLDWLSLGRIPQSCCLPTGFGKTSILAVWLIALANRAPVPRRLVYVVNRRTVVDQTTNEAEKLRENLPKLNLPGFDRLAISTLRGQFADNREWSADPSRPAIVVGTVDMIGSRLLFSGYGVGFKARPLHAGFLGQDSLIVHDEAHLEPAFQKLLERIRNEQERCKEFARFGVMELTATSRGSGADPFELTPAEKSPPAVVPAFAADEPPIYPVWRRLRSPKRLVLHPVGNEKAVPGEIARIAGSCKDKHAAVLIFVRSIEAVTAVKKELEKTQRPVALLTGTIRGKERDALVRTSEFRRFLKGAESGDTVYLVCTSAGEVGIDISADHMVCDLSTFESMAQRFGRVNRYGMRDDSRIEVVHPSVFDDKDKLRTCREATLKLLHLLNGDASPRALGELRDRGDLPCRVEDAFSPEPAIPAATDILFDAWSLTSIRQPMPGRPPVEPYLHGIAEWQPPETQVAWRDEVGIITHGLADLYPPEDLLDDYPLLPHELLRDRSDRVLKQLEVMAGRCPECPAWLVDEQGGVQPTTIGELADRDRKGQLENRTVILPPGAGGLKDGVLDGASTGANDVADDAIDEYGRLRRQRIWDDAPVPEGLRIARTIDIRSDSDDPAGELENSRRLWHWCDRPSEGGRSANKLTSLSAHVYNVVREAERIVAGLQLPGPIAEAVVAAARLHDHGKKRELFQLALGNSEYPRVVLAKSNGRAVARLPELSRHEFSSVLDAQRDPEFARLAGDMQELVLQMVAAHHGRARPHFKPGEAFDSGSSAEDAESLVLETPRRFARLQRKYGRWGLAYLESLLRAADWAASAAEAEGNA